jgi:hypothetical protein
VGLYYETSLNSDIELTAYGAGNALLEHVTAVGVPLYIYPQGFIGIARTEGIFRLDVESHPTGSPSSANNFGIDDLTFQVVPEPCSFALVGFGATALMIARQRK